MNTRHCQFYMTDNNERQNMTPLSIIPRRRDIS
jgi:hypothetical protein